MNQNDRLRQLGHDSYESYLRSAHWLRLREQFQTERAWICLCGEKLALQLHHKTYERLGHEDLDDLQPLCQRCHTLVHQMAAEGLGSISLDGFSDIRRALLYRIEREQREARAREDFAAPRVAKPWDKFEVRHGGLIKPRS